MLSPEVEVRLLAARKNQKAYRPNDEISARLSRKTLVMFVGPAAVGKSFLMNHVAKVDPQFSRVPVFTTREARTDDESGMFRYVPHDDAHLSQLLDQIEAGEVVQYVVHPTTGNIYGSTIHDHPNEFNMLPTLFTIVDSLQHLPFKNSIVIGLAAEPMTWKQRVDERYPHKSSERTKRLREAVSSLDWLLQHPEVKIVDNTSPDTARAVEAVIHIVKHGEEADPTATAYLRPMRELVAHELETEEV